MSHPGSLQQLLSLSVTVLCLITAGSWSRGALVLRTGWRQVPKARLMLPQLGFGNRLIPLGVHNSVESSHIQKNPHTQKRVFILLSFSPVLFFLWKHSWFTMLWALFSSNNRHPSVHSNATSPAAQSIPKTSANSAGSIFGLFRHTFTTAIPPIPDQHGRFSYVSPRWMQSPLTWSFYLSSPLSVHPQHISQRIF